MKGENNLAECVRCGETFERGGYFPRPDENGIPWYRCPSGCEPPPGAEASAVPCHPDERSRSVFDPTKLGAGDALYEPPEGVVAGADWRRYLR